jgi:hypothetical protein
VLISIVTGNARLKRNNLLIAFSQDRPLADAQSSSLLSNAELSARAEIGRRKL